MSLKNLNMWADTVVSGSLHSEGLNRFKRRLLGSSSTHCIRWESCIVIFWEHVQKPGIRSSSYTTKAVVLWLINKRRDFMAPFFIHSHECCRPDTNIAPFTQAGGVKCLHYLSVIWIKTKSMTRPLGSLVVVSLAGCFSDRHKGCDCDSVNGSGRNKHKAQRGSSFARCSTASVTIIKMKTLKRSVFNVFSGATPIELGVWQPYPV